MVRALQLALVATVAATFTPPPAPTRWVSDPDRVLRADTRDALDARLEAYQQATGRQVIVWIGGSTGGVPLEEWAARTFEAWGVGSKKLDDGLAIFLFMKDRAIRVEVGYGLEPAIPDLVASQVIREQALPRLRANDPDAAVTGTVTALLARLGDEPGASVPPPRVKLGPGQLFVFGLAAILVLILFIKYPGLAAMIFWSVLRGGRNGGGRGGFSGGGGRSGGGGASGHW